MAFSSTSLFTYTSASWPCAWSCLWPYLWTEQRLASSSRLHYLAWSRLCRLWAWFSTWSLQDSIPSTYLRKATSGYPKATTTFRGLCWLEWSCCSSTSCHSFCDLSTSSRISKDIRLDSSVTCFWFQCLQTSSQFTRCATCMTFLGVTDQRLAPRALRRSRRVQISKGRPRSTTRHIELTSSSCGSVQMAPISW